MAATQQYAHEIIHSATVDTGEGRGGQTALPCIDPGSALLLALYVNLPLSGKHVRKMEFGALIADYLIRFLVSWCRHWTCQSAVKCQQTVQKSRRIYIREGVRSLFALLKCTLEGDGI